MAALAGAVLGPVIGGITSLATGGCGPSAQEESQFGQLSSLESQMSTAFNQRLGDQTATLNSLNTALSNIAAGKFPPGMDPATLASFTTEAMSSVAGSYRNAAQAASAAISGRGGGAADEAGITGPESQVIGEIAAKGASQESDLLNQLQIENFNIGRENAMSYVTGLEKMAELQSPTSFAEAESGLAKTSTELATTMAQQQSQESSDIGTATTNVAAGIGAMIGQQQSPLQVQQQTQQRTNQDLIGATPGVTPGSINLSDLDLSSPGALTQ
jgi:hypothetical protein